MTTATATSVKVRWAGKTTRATVLRRYKNGKLRVRLDGEATWTGGRMGSLSKAPTMTIEPWQVVAGSERTTGVPA